MTLRLAWAREAATALLADTTAADWDRLNASRSRLPFLDAAAMSAALAAFGNGKERLFTARHDGRVVAMVVLAPQGALRWITFQPSQQPLGAWVADPAYSLHDLGRSLIDGPLGWCLVLSITQIDPELSARTDDDAITEHVHYIDTGYIDLHGGFDDYWAARGKNLRQNLRKQRNKLAAEGIAAVLRPWSAPEDMPGALARYGQLESAGWKAGTGTAVHADNDQGRFYAALFDRAAQRGEARVFEYLFDDRSVAIDLCVLRDGVLTVLKTTYDESIKAFSPASLLREEELQWAFGAGGVRRIEYYGRLMEWHTRLTDQKRALHHLTLYRWPWVKRVAQRRREATRATPIESVEPA